MKTSLVAVTLLAASLHAQQVVYPLHVGDRWQYTIMVVPPDTSYPGPSSRVTGDTIMPGGKTYAVMLWQGYGNSQEYERQIGDSVFEYDSVIKGEFLMFDFTRRPGDTVASVLRGMDTMDIVLNSFYSGPPR
ncbi:MAG TPA: hypothetical protein VL126_05055, partial [Bacteroidota bacterium]|nr:hypothetical protein [Bacteroidota bacterium]